jgi:uncharacterized membrane protein
MGHLLAAAAAFVLLHRGISGSPLRSVITARIGEVAYGRLFQLAEFAGILWLAVAYAGALSPDALTILWSPDPVVRWAQLILQPLAFLFIVTGFTTPNPATFRQEAVADQPDAVRGILRVTRHPFLWGVALFSIGHALAAPTVRNLVLFGTLLFVALTGTLSIDAKRQRSLGPKWTAFVAQTSNLPFLSVLQGRQTLRLGEIGWGKVSVTLGLVLAFTLFHSVLFGRSAAP